MTVECDIPDECAPLISQSRNLKDRLVVPDNQIKARALLRCQSRGLNLLVTGKRSSVTSSGAVNGIRVENEESKVEDGRRWEEGRGGVEIGLCSQSVLITRYGLRVSMLTKNKCFGA